MTPVSTASLNLPEPLIRFVGTSAFYECSGLSWAKTYFVDKAPGYFLKIERPGRLYREQLMYRYFHKKALAPDVEWFETLDRDYMLTRGAPGRDGTWQGHLDRPEALAEIYGETLRALHSIDAADCPVRDLVNEWMTSVEKYPERDDADPALFPVRDEILANRHLLKNDALIHGDYCLPNIMLEDFRFSGFIDLGLAGIGDSHIDLYYGCWSLGYNLKTDAYRQRFLSAYGLDRVNEERIAFCGKVAGVAY